MSSPVETWAEQVRAGDVRAVSRAITAIENHQAEAEALLRLLFPHTGNAYLTGVTGAPGTGKSTLVDRLAAYHRKRNEQVGVIAVDPTSPYSGGAILGDRIRMQSHASDGGMFIRSMATRGFLGGQRAHRGSQNSLRVFRILIECCDDLRRRHRFVLRMPAVVVRYHGDRRVTNLRLTRELGLRHVGHADHFKSQLPVHLRFRERRKLRPFHANVRPAAVNLYSFVHAAIRQYSSDLPAGWVRQCNMGNKPIAKKCGNTVFGPVEELVRHQKLSGSQIFLQRSHRTYRNNALHPKHLHRVNIRAIINFPGQNAVPAPMPRKKRNPFSFQSA